MTLRHKQAFLVIFFSPFTYGPLQPALLLTFKHGMMIKSSYQHVASRGRTIWNAQGGTYDRSV